MTLIPFVRPFAPAALAALLLTLPPSVGGASTYYVAVSGTDLNNGRSWAEAKITIQAAVDLARAGDTVMVGNGGYATGSRSAVLFGLLPNRVVITNAITVRSVNGWAVTFIQGVQIPVTTNGASTVRRVYLGSGATLSGFTLTNGATRADGPAYDQHGGGVYAESGAVVSNCTFSGNSAPVGGASYQRTLNDCTLSSNSAWTYGGGSSGATLNGNPA